MIEPVTFINFNKLMELMDKSATLTLCFFLPTTPQGFHLEDKEALKDYQKVSVFLKPEQIKYLKR